MRATDGFKRRQDAMRSSLRQDVQAMIDTDQHARSYVVTIMKSKEGRLARTNELEKKDCGVHDEH